MRKIKTALLLILCLCLSPLFFACDKTVKIESIELSVEEIVLRPGESEEITATVNPNNATNKNINFILTDDSCAEIVVDSENQYKATITAKTDIIGPVTTYLQAVSEDNSVCSNAVKITVYTEPVALFIPQNLAYNEQTHIISWDRIESASGYKLHIDIEGEEPEEVLCATNEYKINAYYNKFISVKVEALGDGVVYLDSGFSDENIFRFIQAEEPKNLRNEGKYVKFDKVENAESYKVFIYDSENHLYHSERIEDNTYDPSVGVTFDAFEFPNETFTIFVQTYEIKDPENANFDFVKYPSKLENSISITKIATPEKNINDFKFTYSNKTLSWKNLPFATGYVLTRSGVGENVTYTIDADINSFVIDTESDKLEVGVYYYSLKILGNDREYLDSNTSASIQIEKLACPTLKVENGLVAWNEIERNGGYLLKIDDRDFTHLSSQSLSFKLDSSFIAKEYNFVIKAEGNGVDTLTSEESIMLTATKLKSPEKARLENNSTLVFNSSSFVDLLEIHLTYNAQEYTPITKNNLSTIIDGEFTLKQAQIDMTINDYAGGNYSVYAVAYADGYLFSERSESFTFTKLDNTNTMQIVNGKLTYSFDSIQNAESAAVYINDELVHEASEILFNSESFEFMPSQEYNVQLKYYPAKNSDIVISNMSSVFNVTKLNAPAKIYVENGEIYFSTQNSFGNAFYVTAQGSKETQIYTSINNIELEEDVIYTVKMCHEGGSQYLNSDFSNEIKVQLLDYIDDLKISGDLISFSSNNASKYSVNVVTYESANVVYSVELENVLTFSLKDLITNVLKEDLNYNSLNNPIDIYISYIGGNLLEPAGNENLITRLNRSTYTKNLQDKSNILNLRILPSPSNLMTSQLVDLIYSSNLDINELYFDCGSFASMFEFTYTNTDTNETISKVLSTDNYLKIVNKNQGIYTYLLDSSFLPSGNYNISLRTIALNRVDSNPENSYITYNINGFDTIQLNNVIKISQVESIECKDGKIIINDNDTDYIYLLTINGETIFDDVLDKGESLDSIAQEAKDIANNLSLDTLSEIDALFEKIRRFQSKERTLKDNYIGTFNVNCYKIKVPLQHNIGFGDIFTILGIEDEEGLIAFIREKLNTGNSIQSELTNSIKITRLEEISPVIKNGILSFDAVPYAESYEIYLAKSDGEEYIYESPIAINAGDELKYNLIEHYNGQAGDYQIYVVAKTSEDNYLSSVGNIKLNYQILQAPTLKVENGRIVWNSIYYANGYKLEVYQNDKLFDTFVFRQNILSYDAMKKSNDITQVESGNYKFIITALGEVDKEESYVISSLPSSEFEATKLSTPSEIKIKDGKLLISSVDAHIGVEHYLLKVNESEETLKFSTDQLEYELPEKYKEGTYTFTYQAIAGNTNYLSGNVSVDTTAEKLTPTSNIYIENGEIYWESVHVENYKNSSTENIVYTVDVKRESSVKKFDTTTNAYILSADDEVDAGILYSLNIKTLGDSYYYLNSNDKILQNVAKLDFVKDLKIENGKLVWTCPSVVTGTYNYTEASPNGLYFTFTRNGNKLHETLREGVNSFVMGEKYEAGTYYVEVYNVGNKDSNSSDYHFINSKTIYYERTIANNTVNSIVKLEAPTNLNIKDGINLSWTENNAYSLNKYIINLTQNIQNNETTFTGVIETAYSRVEFSKLNYYTIDNENFLILNDDSRIEVIDGKSYFEGNEVFRMRYEGSFDVFIQAYGDDSYITSDRSNQINIILPDPVRDLKVEHGKITWTSNSDANGYILTITRTKDGIADADYNEYNKLIYVTNQTHYNLTDVGYVYTISVSTYSLIDNETNQTMASEKVTIKDYEFNSFTAGNGSKENPYLIADENTLKLIKFNNFAQYKLIADIYLSENFSPLFNESLPFIGGLYGLKEDGTTPTIYNLKIADTSLYGGLLGYMSQDTLIDDRLIETKVDGILTNVRQTNEIEYISLVDNIILEEVEIISGAFVGAIAGFNNGIIKNVIVAGNINSALEKEVDAGASKYNIYSGAIVGRNEGIIENAINYANIMPTAKTGLITGGISGDNKGTIKYCQNYGNVLGSIAGGIVGENKGLIEGVSSFGDITCFSFISNQTQLFAMAGGIAGANRASGKIVNSLVDNKNFNAPAGQGGVINATNDVFAGAPTIYIGGLVGENYGECYNNVIKIELYIQTPTIASFAGKIFGYNKNNSVQHNYCLTGTLVSASVIQSSGSVVIDETNKELDNFDINLVDTLNTNNYSNDNSWKNDNISWNYEENNIILEIKY